MGKDKQENSNNPVNSPGGNRSNGPIRKFVHNVAPGKTVRKARRRARKARRQAEEFSMDAYLDRELLRFTTAGSVDDGKSTLIGRLLYDSKSIFQDQMEALEKSSRLRGEEEVNLALLTDGLRAEREQGITIDVAYRYFSAPKRKFIIADTPGHEQYTRNMVTGASTADLAIILIDARKGVLTQSRRHGFIASLLGIPHLLVAINKMDLVEWSQSVYDAIVSDYTQFSEKLDIKDIDFIPVSALTGDNVVKQSKKMSWYQGRSVLSYLENVTIAADRNLQDFRFSVQYVIRPHQDFRGFAGRIDSGTINKGDEIISLPSGQGSVVKQILEYDQELDTAFLGQSVTISLEDEIDVSRGDMLVRKNNIPIKSSKVEAIICWMDDSKTLRQGNSYLLQQTTRKVQAVISILNYRIDVNNLHRIKSDKLNLNEIGRVEIETAHPLFFDPYMDNRATGSFILIDPASNLTVAAGIIRHETRNVQQGADPDIAPSPETRPVIGPPTEFQPKSSNIRRENTEVDLATRIARNGHRSEVLWFTGLSGSGKTTIAKAVEKYLFDKGKQVFLLDGDNLRHGLNGNLGFSEEDREENIRRAGHMAKLLYDAGFIVLCTFISPRKAMRDMVRSFFPEGAFKEIYIKVDLEEARKRDPKGLYKKAESGEITNMTGVHQPYEANNNAEICIDTEKMSVDNAVTILKELF